MCGICGVVGGERAEAQEALEAQLRLQLHRGPDASGAFWDDNAVIAQNRLRIIDLEGGDPPQSNEDETVAAVLNGEIYNFLALREDLSRRGHRFASRCDTEVIAHIAEELEPTELACRISGMFAFAVWDKRRKRLILGRDRLGKKPLYWWSGAGRLVFGSEIKAVLAHPAVPRELEPRAIPAYLTFGYVPTPHTFFAGVRSVPPGSVLTLEKGSEPRIERYWEPPLVASSNNAHSDLDLDAAAKEVREQLSEAVQRRLISDVPLGVFLSGGIDSSSIVALMASTSSEPVRTFTIGFDDQEGFDERSYANAVARRYGTEHHELVVHPEAVDLVERLVWHYDQPFGDSSAIPTYLLNQFTRREVTVAIAGDGGDELFGGYERFAAALTIDRYHKVPAPLRSAGNAGLSLVPPSLFGGRAASIRRFTGAAESGMPEAYIDWLSFIDEPLRRRLLHHPDAWAREEFAALWESTESSHPLDRLLDINLRTYLLDDLLPKADRMSMAHALEVRSPFLDSELLEFTSGLRPALKVRGMSLKRVLKRAMRDLLPAEILNRRKRGFGVPLDRWFRDDLGPYMDSMLGVTDARVRQHLVPEALDALIEEHRSGARNRGQALWTLLTLEVFLRREGW